MSSFSTVSRLTAFALIVSVAACADTITQGNAQPKRVEGAIELSSSDTTPPPVLEVTSFIVNTSGFTGTGRPGQFLRVETVGSGFPPGVMHVERVAFVLKGGGVVMPASGGGPFGANGAVKAAYGQSCPTPYAEAFAVVTYNMKTVESKHVAAAC